MTRYEHCGFFVEIKMKNGGFPVRSITMPCGHTIELKIDAEIKP